MRWMTTLELAHFASTLTMTGVILVVQVVHYPLFARVGAAAFVAYHRAHAARITWLVLPLMGTEVGSGLALAGLSPCRLWWACVGLSTATFALTGLWAVRLHRQLSAGWRADAQRRLQICNGLRALVWCGHSALLWAWLHARLDLHVGDR